MKILNPMDERISFCPEIARFFKGNTTKAIIIERIRFFTSERPVMLEGRRFTWLNLKALGQRIGVTRRSCYYAVNSLLKDEFIQEEQREGYRYFRLNPEKLPMLFVDSSEKISQPEDAPSEKISQVSEDTSHPETQICEDASQQSAETVKKLHMKRALKQESKNQEQKTLTSARARVDASEVSPTVTVTNAPSPENPPVVAPLLQPKGQNPSGESTMPPAVRAAKQCNAGMTPEQHAYLTSLLSDRELPAGLAEHVHGMVASGMGKMTASEFIDCLKAYPRKSRNGSAVSTPVYESYDTYAELKAQPGYRPATHEEVAAACQMARKTCHKIAAQLGIPTTARRRPAPVDYGHEDQRAGGFDATKIREAMAAAQAAARARQAVGDAESHQDAQEPA